MLSAAYGNDAHQGGSYTTKAAYGLLISCTGFGYGVFLTIFPPTLADAYGYANFGYDRGMFCLLLLLLFFSRTLIRQLRLQQFTNYCSRPECCPPSFSRVTPPQRGEGGSLLSGCVCLVVVT